MSKWLVNDCLGAIGGSRTLWHELRDKCGLADMTDGYTPFDRLAYWVERVAADLPPDLIVRNASYFRPLKINRPTISIAQDVLTGPARAMQAEVIGRSDVVVFNTQYTRDRIGCAVPSEIIPIGTDFDLFHPAPAGEVEILRNTLDIRPNSVLFVGSAAEVKGWKLLREIIDSTDLPFVVVTKDGARIDHPRVRNFGPIPQAELRDNMVCCAALVCTSVTETQHLAGIEAMACGLPVVAPPVGIYHDLQMHPNNPMEQIGNIVKTRNPGDFRDAIRNVLDDRHVMNPRLEAKRFGLDLNTCIDRWRSLIARVEAA